MATRVVQITGKPGVHVEVDVPKWVREKTDAKSKIVRRKGGKTRQEATRQALVIEANLLAEWEALRDPLSTAQAEANRTGRKLDLVVDDLMRAAGWSPAIRERVIAAMSATDAERGRQGIKKLEGELRGEVEGVSMGVATWQQRFKTRALNQRNTSASTKKNWEGRLRDLSKWLGHDHVKVMERSKAFDYKLHLLQTINETTAVTYISLLSGFWNWKRKQVSYRERTSGQA